MIIYYNEVITRDFCVDMDKLFKMVLEECDNDEVMALYDFGDDPMYYLKQLGLSDSVEISDDQIDMVYDKLAEMLGVE